MYYILWVIGKEIGHIDLGHIESPGFPLHLSYITAVLFSPVYALPLHNPWSQGEGDGVFTILSTVTNNLVFFFCAQFNRHQSDPRGTTRPPPPRVYMYPWRGGPSKLECLAFRPQVISCVSAAGGCCHVLISGSRPPLDSLDMHVQVIHVLSFEGHLKEAGDWQIGILTDGQRRRWRRRRER